MSDGNSSILFDKFEVLECIKKDSFAGVYLANHIYLNKRIILKVLNTTLELDNSIIERFKREAKLLAKLDHENIIKVLDFGAYENSFYISFEYFESKNLREIIKDNRLSDQDKKQLLIQLFKGLEFAHKNGIIHRDIKPENILVNNNLQLKIADFGLALGINDNLITSHHSAVGTPSYMSPEQILGSELTIKSDLFSAGIVAYELYTSKNLFLGSDINDTLNKILNYSEQENLFEELQIDDNIQSIIKKLLRKNPDERIDSAEDVLKILSLESISINNFQSKYHNKSLIISALSVAMVIVVTFIIWKIYSREDSSEIFNKSYNQTKSQLDSISVPHYNPMIENVDTNTQSNVVENKNNEQNDTSGIFSNTLLTESKTNLNKQTGFGFLYIECNPWAKIYIDDVYIDVTPIKENIILSPGYHSLKLKHLGYPNAEMSLVISDKETEVVKVNLDTLFAFLDFRIFPWGDIYVNGKYLGQTPLQKVVRVFSGYSNIAIKNPGYTEFNTKVYAENKDTMVIEHKF